MTSSSQLFVFIVFGMAGALMPGIILPIATGQHAQ